MKSDTTKTDTTKTDTTKTAAAPNPKPVAPVVAAPVAVKPAAPVVAAATVIGQPHLTSRRITPGTAITGYRVVPSQRKSFKGYYLQGGTLTAHPLNGRDKFDVSVEIPFAVLADAQKRMTELQAAMKPVSKVA